MDKINSNRRSGHFVLAVGRFLVLIVTQCRSVATRICSVSCADLQKAQSVNEVGDVAAEWFARRVRPLGPDDRYLADQQTVR